MIYPVWPMFVTEALKADMAALGFLDGLGDALVSLSQAGSGLPLRPSPEKKDLYLVGLSLRRPVEAGLRRGFRLAPPRTLPHPRPAGQDPEPAPGRRGRRRFQAVEPRPEFRPAPRHGQPGGGLRHSARHPAPQYARVPAPVRPGRDPFAGRRRADPGPHQGSEVRPLDSLQRPLSRGARQGLQAFPPAERPVRPGRFQLFLSPHLCPAGRLPDRCHPGSLPGLHRHGLPSFAPLRPALGPHRPQAGPVHRLLLLGRRLPHRHGPAEPVADPPDLRILRDPQSGARARSEDAGHGALPCRPPRQLAGWFSNDHRVLRPAGIAGRGLAVGPPGRRRALRPVARIDARTILLLFVVREDGQD